MKLLLLVTCVSFGLAWVPAQGIEPSAQEMQQIKSKLAALTDALDALRLARADDDLIADVEVARHAVELTLRFPEEFTDQSKIRAALSALDHGLQRAQQLTAGKPEWPEYKGRVSRGYRSSVDGTAQPYRVIIPASYDKAKPIPLYVYLHGRGDTDFETNWVGGPDRKGEGSNGDRMQLQVFGRFNCSFRWAGETDVLEAIQSVRKRYNIDPIRIVLAGFSMGGAGAWQTGLHYPDLFAALEVDAGVIGSRRNTEGLSPAQKAAVAHYGVMIDHALNIYNVPTVAYAGEKDAQLASSTSMREQLAREGFASDHPSPMQWKAKDINALFLAIPNAGHSHATGETARSVNSFVAEAMKRGRITPDHVRFVTYTTRYNRDFWVTVDGLQRHFERAEVDASRDSEKTNYTVTTKNVSRLLLTDMSAAREISIDGDVLTLQPAASILLERKDHWRPAEPEAEGVLRKKHNLQGPLNDAFLDSFMCVTPTGQHYNAIADEYGRQELARFTRVFGKTYRGDVRTRKDEDLTPTDIAVNHLVLLGDPGSNKILGQIIDKLPIKWTRETIEIDGKTYRSAEHIPILIYPNPLNPNRYIVMNSGMTAQERGEASSIGDYAILKATNSGKQPMDRLTMQIVETGIFDENWKINGK
jgi:dienelactone hydrolase